MSKDGTLISIGVINEFLFEDYLCVPPYNSINGKWISDCFKTINSDQLDNLKYQVTKEILLPWRRAYQVTYFYTEIEPFKELVKIIDAATLAYYEDNWICSYMTLIPVIEAIIDRWGRVEVKNYDDRRPLTKKTEALLTVVEARLDPDIYWHQHLLIQHGYINRILGEVFFLQGTNYKASKQDGFNRNVMLHLLSIPDIFTNNLHTLRLFLLLDILAILYAATHPRECKGISPVSDATYKQELMDAYFSVYKSCALRSSRQGNYQITLQKRIYDIYNI
jgi:hypothetical protein